MPLRRKSANRSDNRLKVAHIIKRLEKLNIIKKIKKIKKYKTRRSTAGGFGPFSREWPIAHRSGRGFVPG